jgi:hypothetical protein
MGEELSDDTRSENEDAASGGAGGTGRRKVGLIAAVVVGLLVVGFLVFRPDRAFTDTVVNDSVSNEVLSVIDQTSSTTVPGQPTSVVPAAPVVEGRGAFTSQGGHSAVGEVAVVREADGRRQLILQDLDADNGPDLRLYFSPSSEGNVEGGVDLGPLRGNKGTQSYEVPADVDLTATPTVVIWCERFSTPFGTATLTP